MQAQESPAHRYQVASHYLSQIDADWARLVAQVGPCTHQPKPAREPYEPLVRAVAYQQLHARAGDAIITRLLTLYPQQLFPLPIQLLATEFDNLRACGFSARKIKTLYRIAEATQIGLIPPRHIADSLSNDALISRLVTLPGIGRWTVEMLLIYTLERLDILPAEDFGVREGYRRLKSLNAAPNSNEIASLGQAWSPYRTVAAWYLWRIPRT